ncbi:MAG TPA: tRNA dihydrouridine synthase DusB [Steroidobacteraceae bacterium]|nr:tRNA dihydrouridine synthase DusB [Steroidobacteraceae bacterium]
MPVRRAAIAIGPYRLEGWALLAPMAGVTDLPFRRLCRRLGAALAAGEMISADRRLWNTGESRRRRDHTDEPEPRVVQIAGGDAEAMAEAARRNVDTGAQVVDINMGCPAKKVCSKDAGSALLRDEATVAAILHATVRAVDVPVTLKIRTGWAPDRRNAVSIARIAEAEGVRALAVHGRTRACRFDGDAEYETIAAVKRSVGIPVFANGDIDTPAKAVEVLRYTGADGVMVGRAAQGRPWIFREIASHLAGIAPAPPTPAEVRDIMLAHLRDLYEFYGAEPGVRIARKHIGWYCSGRPHAQAFRQSIMQATAPEAQIARVQTYFDALQAQPAEAA